MSDEPRITIRRGRATDDHPAFTEVTIRVDGDTSVGAQDLVDYVTFRLQDVRAKYGCRL